MSVHKKRLFVGGLNSGTSEQDISERFKTFGSVSSVELHKVEKKEGFPEKTFAYVDIESSDTNIRRCVSMLSNTKWRGGVLKIELARESFLSRLQREREELASQKTKLSNKESTCSPSLAKEMTKPVPSGVPGTLIPGQKNWVVGKFGRALPVVHLRPKNGRRIMKFDPSKTVHNLKRIKDGDDDDVKHVSELTWNLEERKNRDVNYDKSHVIRTCSSSSDEESGHDASEKQKFSKKKRERKVKEKRTGIDNSSEDLPSINSEENVSSKMSLNSIDSDNESKVSKKKYKYENMKNEKAKKFERVTVNKEEVNSDSEKLKSKRKRKNGTETDFSATTNEEEAFNSIQGLTNGEEVGETAGKERKKQKKKLKESKNKIKCESESDDSSLSEMEESLHDEDDLKKPERKETKKQLASKKLKDLSDNDEDDISTREIRSSSQGVTNEEENDRTKRKEKKKRKKNSSEKTLELSVDKKETILMTTEDETVDSSEELKEEDTEKEKRKEKKKRKEMGKERDLEHSEDTDDSEETGFKKSPGNNRKKDKIAIDTEPVQNISSVDPSRVNDEILFPSADNNNNEQIHQEDESKTDLKKGESKAKRKKKKKDNADGEHSNILDESEKRRRKKLKIKQGNSSKKLESNAKRLKALKDRETNTSMKQSLVASALQNLDKKDQPKNPKHITFDEEEEEDEEEEKGDAEDNIKEKQANHGGTGKISGSKATNWLGLDSDTGDNGATLDEPVFDAKPQFEGKSGQKLFELQKSYRGDSRFQLDKRFIESDDESDEEDLDITSVEHPNDPDMNVDDDDTVTTQLSQEKSMAMSVLRGILGQNFGNKFGDSSTRTDKFKDSNLLRYDPTKDDHAQFEQKPIKEDSPEPTATVKESQQSPADVMPGVPEATHDKYYEVKSDALTAMFGEKKQSVTTTPFTFLSNQDDPDDEAPAGAEWGEAEVLQSKPWNPVMLPYDSSGDEDDAGIAEEEEEDQQQTDRQPLSNERFFFHFGDQELENTVYDQENPFLRTETLEQLNQHWVNVRSELTQDYKKKHKDALRRNSKMAAKRARMR